MDIMDIDTVEKLVSYTDRLYIYHWRNKDREILPPCVTPDVTTMNKQDLYKSCFEYRGRFYDNSLKECEHDFDYINKAAMLNVYFKDDNKIIGLTDYSKYVWYFDKHANKMGYTGRYIRADKMNVTINQQKLSEDCLRVRHNGSQEGISDGYQMCMTYNMSALARLQQGITSTGILKNIGTGADITTVDIGNNYPSIDVELHHIKVVNGSSIKKTVEPSVILGLVRFDCMSHRDIYEILQCIAIPTVWHKAIHNKGRNTGLKDWKEFADSGKIKIFPYYLESEANYNETLDWLSAICYKFDRDIMPSYSNFIESIW